MRRRTYGAVSIAVIPNNQSFDVQASAACRKLVNYGFIFCTTANSQRNGIIGEGLQARNEPLELRYLSEKTAVSAVDKCAAHTVGVTGSSPVPPIVT